MPWSKKNKTENDILICQSTWTAYSMILSAKISHKKKFAKTFWKRLTYFRWKYFKIYRIENFLKQLTSNQYYGQNKTLHYKSEHLF